MEREVIFAEDAERIFGKRAWASRSEEIMDAEPTKPAETKKRKATETVVAEPVTEVVTEITEKVPEVAMPEVSVTEAPAEETPAAAEVPVAEVPTLSEAPVLTETPELTEPAVAPKRPRKRKADDNLFGGFDFDQEDKK